MKRAMEVSAAVLILGMFFGIPNVSAVCFSDVSTGSVDRETFDVINSVSDNG